MIAESSPFKEYTVEKKLKWIKTLFQYIQENQIKFLSYINVNWDELRMFAANNWGYQIDQQFSGAPLSGVFDGIGVGPGGMGSSLSSIGELAANASYYFVSMNRVLVTYSYTMYGVFRTLVDQPGFYTIR